MKKSQIVLIISLVIFIISLTQTAVYTKGSEMHAFVCFILGWADLEDSLSWLANPVLLAAWFFILIKQIKISIIFSILAFCLTLLYLSTNTIVTNEAGSKSVIISLGLGYYLWVLSCFSMLLGNTIILVYPEKHK